MRVLITGGGGFIGSHLVDLLVDQRHDVAVLDDWTTGSLGNLGSLYQQVRDDPTRKRIHTGSVVSAAAVAHALDPVPEVVFHLAAQVDVGASVANPVADARTNVTGTLRMLEASAAAGVRRFVFVSTAAIFGSRGPTAYSQVASEPISPYGASKAAAELYVELYDRMGVDGYHNMVCSTVVFSNVYGPRQRPDFGAVNRFARALLVGEPVTLYGDGGNVRDYLYVADAARALAEAGGCLPAVRGKRTLGAVGRWLVGTGIGTTDATLLAMVNAAITGRYVPIAEVDSAVQHAPARPADVRTSVFPRAEQAMTPLAEGLRLTVEAIRKELGL